jgi:CelD/BcsL family acetyltransferase involved in cellulose biosynthesis
MNNFVVHEIENEDSWLTLQAKWEEVWQSSPSKLPSGTMQWCAGWWKYLRGQSEALVLEVKEGNTAIGFVPLAKKCGTALLPIKYSLITPGLFDYQSIIARTGHESAVIKVMTEFLSKKQWDCFELKGISWSEEQIESWEKEWMNAGAVPERSLEDRWVLNLKDIRAWEQYAKIIDKRWLQTISRETRRIERKGARFRTAENLGEALKVLRVLFELRKEKQGANGVAADPYFKFHSEFATSLFHKKIIGLYYLECNERVISVLYGFWRDEIFHCYLTAFDESWAKYSPGTVLIAHRVQEAIKEGVELLDFGRGSEAYKDHWRARPQKISNLRVTSKKTDSRFRNFNESILLKLRRVLKS